MLNKEHRLKKNQDFRRIYKKGKSRSYRSFIFYYRRNNDPNRWRVGFSVSKKTGKAVQRNLVKRRFREACRNMTDSFTPGYDYIFIVRKAAVSMSYKAICSEIIRALKEQSH